VALNAVVAELAALVRAITDELRKSSGIAENGRKQKAH
jgi:hypothetical protein